MSHNKCVKTLFLVSYESTSSEESSGEEKPKAAAEDEDSSEAEEETDKKAESQPVEKPEKGAESQQKDVEVPAAEGGASAAEQQGDRGLLDPGGSPELLEEQAEGWGGPYITSTWLNCFAIKYKNMIGLTWAALPSWEVVKASLGSQRIS